MKTFKRIVLPLLLLGSVTAQAQDIYKKRQREVLLTPERTDNISAEDLNTYPEMYQFRDSVLSERDTTTGIRKDAYYTPNDESRLSFSYHFSYDYEKPTKIQAFDVIYLNKMEESYRDLWWGFQLKRTTAKYDAIADEKSSGTARRDNQQSFLMLGYGVGHRFKIFKDLFNSDRFFESVNVFGNYIFHLDTTDDERYRGFGYTAEYLWQYRSSQRYFYGTKLSYNWAHVERAAAEDENLLARSLVFGWTTLAFELGFYF